jgi:hypothetical protein
MRCDTIGDTAAQPDHQRREGTKNPLDNPGRRRQTHGRQFHLAQRQAFQREFKHPE